MQVLFISHMIINRKLTLEDMHPLHWIYLHALDNPKKPNMKWYIEGYKEFEGNHWFLVNTYSMSAISATPAKARDFLNAERDKLKAEGWKKVCFDTKHRD